MQYKVNRGDKGKVEVKVDIPKASFISAYSDVIEVVSRDQKFPGFRPGKIPANVVEDTVGINKILNDAANFLVSKTINEIFEKEKIIPLGKPSIAVHTLSKDSPFSFTATLVSKPNVKIGDWKKMKIKRIKAKPVTEKDINESIKNIYEAWKKQKSASSTQGQESNEKRATGSEDTMTQRDNENKSGKFIYDAQGNKVFLKDDEKDKQKKDAGINDEFAKAIGARDLRHLQELVRADLEKIVNGEVESKLEEELFEEILKLSDVEVPDILVDDELNRIIVRITQNLEAQKKKLEDYLKEQNTTLDALKAKLRPQAEKNVQITLIMDEIGKAEKVKITPEEIDNAAKGVDESKLDEKQKTDMRNYLAVSIFQAKTLDLVKKVVTAS